jgi:hypothetical protein
MLVVLLPVPVSVTVCGLPVALLVMLSVPLRVPVVVGVNVMATVQLAPAASVAAQVVLRAKSPLAVMPVMDRLLPLPVSVTIWTALVLPCVWLGKLRLVGVSDSVAAVGVTLTVPKASLVPALVVEVTEQL